MSTPSDSEAPSPSLLPPQPSSPSQAPDFHHPEALLPKPGESSDQRTTTTPPVASDPLASSSDFESEWLIDPEVISEGAETGALVGVALTPRGAGVMGRAFGQLVGASVGAVLGLAVGAARRSKGGEK